MSGYRVICIALPLAGLITPATFGAETGGPVIVLRDFVPEQGICRAKRPISLGAYVENTGDSGVTVQPRLIVPNGVRITHTADTSVRIDAAQTRRVSWIIEAQDAGPNKFELEIRSSEAVVASATLDLPFLPAVPIKKLPYIPEPQPAKTSVLVGAIDCPLWEADKPHMWTQIRKHPERTPALGFYSQENPEVADWETKWAVEHGISFFVYCWYRASQGEPVKMNFGSAIHDALLKSRFLDKMKFTIMWTNHDKGKTGVSDEKDLMTNLLPFWIDNYFKHPSYLKIDNKPVLFVYRPENVADDLGSADSAAHAFDLMRQACKDAGFAGLYILGEYRGHEPNVLRQFKQLGLDYVFAYCWYVPKNPTPDQAIKAQMEYIKQTRDFGILPEVVTVSQAWSGWADEGTIWKIPPAQYEGLLRQAKDYIATFPAGELGSKMILLDNWNEWGEGHYIAPYREYGFGYLDAVRKVFSDAAEDHTDLIPEDIGLGPYDRAYTAWNTEQEKLHNLFVRKVQKGGADEPGLVAWWAFDESKNSPVALDYSGHRLGGVLKNATRAKGIDGSALVCDGGCVLISADEKLPISNAMSVECWVRTDVPDQNDKWLLSNHRAGVGFGLGMSHGKPCLIIPKESWSHLLAATETLPLGRWVHLAGTYDNQTMRIYIDGRECGSMDRGGPANPSTVPLCLGSFAPDHPAHFTGLLDDVKLYDRVLNAEEIRAHANRFATH